MNSERYGTLSEISKSWRTRFTLHYSIALSHAISIVCLISQFASLDYRDWVSWQKQVSRVTASIQLRKDLLVWLIKIMIRDISCTVLVFPARMQLGPRSTAWMSSSLAKLTCVWSRTTRRKRCPKRLDSTLFSAFLIWSDIQYSLKCNEWASLWSRTHLISRSNASRRFGSRRVPRASACSTCCVRATGSRRPPTTSARAKRRSRSSSRSATRRSEADTSKMIGLDARLAYRYDHL